MSKNIDNISEKLNSLGLTLEEIKVYLAIVEGRGDTALIISQQTKLKRTTVYRILDNLIAKKIVITRAGERGLHYLTSPAESFDLILAEQESKLAHFKRLIPELKEQLGRIQKPDSNSSQVRYYHGVKGLKQVTYNSLRAKNELLTYELSTMNAFMDQEEAEKLRARFVENKVHIKTLTNVTEMSAWTDITEMVEKYWEIRHLDPNEKPFQFEILIYNDVYCMYKYTGNEVFCVEIKNAELAQMQRTLFYYLWDMAKPLKILDNHGTAKLALPARPPLPSL